MTFVPVLPVFMRSPRVSKKEYESLLARSPLPSNEEAERAVLGSILIENSSINQVLEILIAEDFYNENHSKIMSCMIDLDRESNAIDVLTLYEWMSSKGIIEEIGGPPTSPTSSRPFPQRKTSLITPG